MISQPVRLTEQTAAMIDRSELDRELARSADLLHQLDIDLAALFRVTRASNDVLAATLGVARPRRAPPRPMAPPPSAGETPAAAGPAPRAMRPAAPAVGTSLPTGGSGLAGEENSR